MRPIHSNPAVSSKKPGRTLLSLAVLSVAAVLLTQDVQAVPYASAVTNSAGTVTFILNESADNVTVLLNNGASTLNLGALGRGPQSFSLGAATNFQIKVTKSTASAWSQISVDS